ncbi:hypothetical protein [Streptomyces sp. NPDC088256]|uniref:hypothetical protein n=1 Tax=Streptomyces sp. NPDC088256 TaxID=3365848 RepID=UPI0038162259
MPEPQGPETDGPAKKTVKKPVKKAAKRAALRPRPPGSILNNPALAGAQTVVARSVLGQGGAGTEVPAPLPQAPTEVSPVLPPRPQTTNVVPAPSRPAEGQGRGEPAAGETYQPTPPTESSPPPADRPVGGSEPKPEPEPEPKPEAEAEAEPRTTAPKDAVVAGISEAHPEPLEAADVPAPSHEEPPGHKQLSGYKEPRSSTAAPTPAAAAPQPASGAESSTHTAGARKKRAASPRGGAKLGPAHEAIFRSWRNSRVDLKMGRQSWQTHAFRFAPDLVAILSRRVAQDSTSAGKALTAAQYVDAAMTLYLPRTIPSQLELAEEFLLSRDSDVGTGKQASHRVSAEVYAIASPLANELRIAGHPRLAVHVYSGVLDRFLRDLEEEGPLGPTA